MKIGAVFEISYAHRLQNYEGPCRELHGHNAKIEIKWEGDLQTHTGMVVDFAVLKRWTRKCLENYDHFTILQSSDPLVNKIPTRLHRTFLPPTAETIALEIKNNLMNPPGVRVVLLRFWETRDCYVEV